MEINLIEMEYFMIYVIYHANCLDGAASKYVAWLNFKENATYLSCQYGQAFPIEKEKLTDQDEIYILDFSFDRETLDEIYSLVKKLIVIDHHDSAERALQDCPYAIFDMNESGVSLTWKYFFQELTIPNYLFHIKDRDLWRFESPNTKPFCAYCYNNKYDNPEFWDSFYQSVSNYIDAVQQGKTIIDYIDKTAKTFINKRYPKYKIISLNGYKAAIYNTTTLISEIAEAIYTNVECDFTISYFISPEGKVCFSLRAPKTNEVKVNEYAEQHGGGGHEKAAGFNLPLETGLRLIQHFYNQL